MLARIFKHKKNKDTKAALEATDLTKNTPRLHDLFTPDGLEENNDYLQIGPSRYTRVFVVSVYPSEIGIGWLDRVYSLGDVDVSVHIEPVPNRTVIYDLTRQVSSARAQHMIYEKQGNILYLPELEQTINDLETIRAMVQTNREKVFYVTVFITLHARTLDELNTKSDNLEDILASSSVMLRSLLFRQLEGYKSVMPINNPEIKDYWRNITTGGVAAMMPIANSDLSHPSGVFLGFNLHSGSPMFYDSFIGPPYLSNQHVCCFGTSGSGKSVDLKTTMVMRSAALGQRIVILDPDNEYSRLVEKFLGGEVINITSNDVTGINLFDIEPDIDEYGNPTTVNLNDKVNEIRGLINAILQNKFGRHLSPQESTILEESIRQVYSDKKITTDPGSLYEQSKGIIKGNTFAVGKVRKEMPTLTDLVKVLETKEHTKDLTILLKPFLRGGTLGLFDCQSTIDLTATQVISFNLRNINDEFTRFYAMYVILAWAWQKFAQGIRGVNKRIVLDEAWTFMKYQDSRDFLEQLSKRGRKYQTSLVVASQQIEDFIAHKEGRSIVANCETLILHRQNPTMVDTVAETFKLSGGCREYLRTFAPGEAIVKIGGAITAVRITPTALEWPWVQTVRNWEGGTGQ